MPFWNNSPVPTAYGPGWMSWVSFFRDVPLGRRRSPRFALAEAPANTGWQWWHSDVLALSDRPRFIKRNAAGRLHSDEGPAIGVPRRVEHLRHQHGYRLCPTRIITSSPHATRSHRSIDRSGAERGTAADRAGDFRLDGFFEYRGGKVIDKDEVFGRPRRLLELKLKGEKIRVMDVYNGSLEPDGTRRRFMLGAVAGVNTVHEAVAASYGLNPAHTARRCERDRQQSPRPPIRRRRAGEERDEAVKAERERCAVLRVWLLDLSANESDPNEPVADNGATVWDHIRATPADLQRT